MSDENYDYECDIPHGLEYGVTYTNEEVNQTLTNVKFVADLDKHLKEIGDLLKSKNKAYGNSALNPAGIFSKLTAEEALCSRIDDKLMRIKNKGINDETEDTVDDLIGYLFLLRMAIAEEKEG